MGFNQLDLLKKNNSLIFYKSKRLNYGILYHVSLYIQLYFKLLEVIKINIKNYTFNPFDLENKVIY